MAIPFLSDVDNNLNENKNFVVDRLPSSPAIANSKAGQIYYNTTENVLYWFNGTEWQVVGTGSGTGGAEIINGVATATDGVWKGTSSDREVIVGKQILFEVPVGHTGQVTIQLSNTPKTGTATITSSKVYTRAKNDGSVSTNMVSYEFGGVDYTLKANDEGKGCIVVCNASGIPWRKYYVGSGGTANTFKYNSESNILRRIGNANFWCNYSLNSSGIYTDTFDNYNNTDNTLPSGYFIVYSNRTIYEDDGTTVYLPANTVNNRFVQPYGGTTINPILNRHYEEGSYIYAILTEIQTSSTTTELKWVTSWDMNQYIQSTDESIQNEVTLTLEKYNTLKSTNQLQENTLYHILDDNSIDNEQISVTGIVNMPTEIKNWEFGTDKPNNTTITQYMQDNKSKLDLYASGGLLVRALVTQTNGTKVNYFYIVNYTVENNLHSYDFDCINDIDKSFYIYYNGSEYMWNKESACLVGTTLVHTDKGLKFIKDINIGDKVLSYNFETKEEQYKQVNNIVSHDVGVLYRIELDDDIIQCTYDEPFYMETENIVQGQFVSEYDKLFSTNENVSEVKRVTTKRNCFETVYDLSVGDNYNFFITKNKILVATEQVTKKEE